MPFNPLEEAAFRRLLDLALVEDLGEDGDLTSIAVIPAELTGEAVLCARSPGILAGLPAARAVFARVDNELRFETHLADGSVLHPGERIATIHGRRRSILTAERTALNFVQRLSGVATQTHRYAQLIADLPCQLLDTRKTTPGWRLLEKYAVRMGGGHNHRLGLFDGILIKDNHLAGFETADGKSRIIEAIRCARRLYPTLPIEVEVDTLEQLDEALAEKPAIVLLDNMSLSQMQEAVRRRNASAAGVLLEASGGIHLDTVRAIAETGVDRISVGALTHSATALDIALDFQP